MKKTVMSILLIAGVILSGCHQVAESSTSKGKKKNSRSSTTSSESAVSLSRVAEELPVTDPVEEETTTEEIKTVKPSSFITGEKCIVPVVQEMYDEAKERISDPLSKVGVYHVSLEFETRTGSTWHYSPADDREFSIEISNLEFDPDKVFICEVNAVQSDRFKDGYKELPGGIVVIFGIETTVTGKVLGTGDDIVFNGASYFYGTCFGMTLTCRENPSRDPSEPSPEIVEKGEIEFCFDALDLCYERWEYDNYLPNERYRSKPMAILKERFWESWDPRFLIPDEYSTTPETFREHNCWMEKFGRPENALLPPTPTPAPTPIPYMGDGDDEDEEFHQHEHYDEEKKMWVYDE